MAGHRVDAFGQQIPLFKRLTDVSTPPFKNVHPPAPGRPNSVRQVPLNTSTAQPPAPRNGASQQQTSNNTVAPLVGDTLGPPLPGTVDDLTPQFQPNANYTVQAEQILQNNAGQSAGEITSNSNLNNTSIVITLSYVLGAAMAVLIAGSWDATLTLGFSNIGLNPGTASLVKSMIITMVGVFATVMLNKVANWWANWKALPKRRTPPLQTT